MINVNNYNGLSDNEVIENAIQNRTSDGIVLIPPRVSDLEPRRALVTWAPCGHRAG